jgi:hypothetical protein
MPITIDPPLGTPLIVTEGGNALSLTVGVTADILDLSPSVTLDVTTNSNEISLNATTLTLNATNPTANLTISAPDDATLEADRNAAVNIALSPNIQLPPLVTVPPLAVPLTISDPAALPQLSITPTSAEVTEGGASAALTIALPDTVVPLPPIALTLTPGEDVDLGQGAGTPVTVNLADTTPTTVNITAVADGIVEASPEISNIGIALADPALASVIALPLTTLPVTVTDALLPGLPSISITPTSTEVTEGGASAALTIALPDTPVALPPIALTLTPGEDVDLGQGAGTPVTVNLADTTPTTVNITAVTDGIVEASPEISNIGIALADPALASVIALPLTTLPVTVTDALLPGLPSISITPTSTEVTEGGASAALTIALPDTPVALPPIALTLTPGEDVDLGQGAGTPVTVNLAATTPTTVNITAVADGIVEDSPEISNIDIAFADPALSDLIALPLTTLPVAVTDASLLGLPSISITPADGVVNITEGETSDTFSIALSGVPVAPVTLTLTPSNDQIDLGAGAGQSTTLNFTLDNALTPQVVSLTAVADGIVEDAQSSTITVTTDAADLVNVSLPPVTVNITDSNLLGLPGIVINPSPLDGIPLTEGDDPKTLELALNIAPPVPVTLTLTPDNEQVDLGGGAGIPLTLNFAGDATALVPQTISISAVDDGIVEGPQTTTITTSINTTDPGFAGLNIPNFTIDITDSGDGNSGTGGSGVSGLIQGSNDIFTVQGSPGQEVVLQFDLGQSNTSFFNEIGVYVVDDAQGTINGIAPGQPNYLEAALNNAQPIFSVLPDSNGLLSNVSLSRQLSFEAGTQLGLYLVQDSTAAAVRADLAAGQTLPNVFFGSPSFNANGVDYLETSTLNNGGFTLAWRDQQGGSNQSFNNVVLTAQALTNSTLPVGTQLQQTAQLELIDLRAQAGQVVNFNFGIIAKRDITTRLGCTWSKMNKVRLPTS